MAPPNAARGGRHPSSTPAPLPEVLHAGLDSGLVSDGSGCALRHDRRPPVRMEEGAGAPWVVLLQVNEGFYGFFRNWYQWYRRLALPKGSARLVVAAMDGAVERRLREDYAPGAFDVQRVSGANFTRAATKFHDVEYKALVGSRASLVLTHIERGEKVLYTDVDTVWRHNPLPYLVGPFDIWHQIDEWNLEPGRPGGYRPDAPAVAVAAGRKSQLCTGFFAMRPSAATRGLLGRWAQFLATHQEVNQPSYNRLARPLIDSGDLRVAELPWLEFPSGHIYFGEPDHHFRGAVQKGWPSLAERHSRECAAATVVVHRNQISGKANKQRTLKEHRLWVVS